MNLSLSFCKTVFRKAGLFIAILVLFPALAKSQNSLRVPSKPIVNSYQPINYPASWGNLKTAATATCPTSPVGLAGQDTLGNTVTNGQTFACNQTPFYIYVPVVSGNIASPCIETEYTPFHTALGTHGSETFYEGGVNIGCIGPAGGGCSFPIGQGALTNTNWGLILSLLDPSQQHDFVFCRNGSLNNAGSPTTTLTLIDCWTGNQLPSSPASAIYNNTNPPNTTTCFTMTLPANNDIGTAAFTITPTVTPGAFIDFNDGEAYVNSPLMNAGTYTVGYSFTPSASSGCSMVTGSFVFTITNVTPTVTVNSPFICSGGSDTLRANGATTYSWTPSTGLSATTGSMVITTPTTSPMVYTVTGANGACTSTATSTVTLTSSPSVSVTLSSPAICTGAVDTLKANGANTYTWSPSTDLSSPNGGTVTATPSTTTVYTVTGTVGTCTATPATVTVTVNQTPTVTVNSANLCLADTATLTASGATTYSWSPSTALNDTTVSVVMANPTVTTIYTVTGTSNNCSASATSTVTVYSMPTFTVNKATICSGNSVPLIASDSTLNYTWSPNTGLNTTNNDTVIATPSVTTIYTVTGSNPACPSLTITDSVIVKLSPTITVLSPTVCSGTTATITAIGATSYTWSPLTNLTSSVTNDTVYINNPTTNLTYTAYGTGANGCTDSAVSNVVISNHLGIVSGTPVIQCYGTPFGLTAIGASTYTWTSNDPSNLDFGGDTTWAVQSSIANVGTYTLAIYGESHSGTYCNGYDTVYVTINPTPTVSAIGSTNVAICAGDSVTLAVTASGPPITAYGWYPSAGLNDTTQSSVKASPSVTTVYLATGGDAFGCSSNVTFTVNVIPVPSFTVNSTSFCLGGSDSLKVVPTTTASGAQTYSWSPSTGLSATTGSAVVTSPNTSGSFPYTVTGTNTISTSSVTCSATATTTVVVIPPPTLTVTPTNTTVCVGTPVSILAAGSAITYTWTSTSTTFTAINGALIDAPSVTTIYTVTGTGAVGGCTGSTTATVTVNDVPTFTISNSNPMFCKGDSSVLTAVATSTTAATYTWTASGFNTTTANSVTVAPTTTTIYTVNASATVGGCPTTPQTTTVTVNQPPTLTVTPTNTTVCVGNVAALTVVGASTYTWSSTSTTYTANAGNLVDAPLATTIYSVTGQDAFGCYSNTVTATINVTPVPTASASSNSPVCIGQTINLAANTVSGTATYSWTASNGYTSNIQNPTIANATNTATYSLTVTDGGCTSAPSVVSVAVKNPPIVTVSPSTLNVCPGTTVTYTASGAQTYTWSPSAQNGSTVSVTPSSTTVYSVTGTDANNCSATATATVSVNPVVAVMTASPETGDAPLNVLFTNQSTNGNSYVWNYGNGTSNQTTTSLADSSTTTTYTASGTYTATLIASNTTNGTTCSSTYTLQILVTEGYLLVIPNVFTPNGDNINEDFTVKGEGVSNYSIEILDRWGLKMYSSTSITSAWDGKTAGGKDVPADTYFYIINATNGKTGESKTYKGFLTLIR